MSKSDKEKTNLGELMPLNLFCLRENDPANSGCQDTHYQQYIKFWADQCHVSVL